MECFFIDLHQALDSLNRKSEIEIKLIIQKEYNSGSAQFHHR